MQLAGGRSRPDLWRVIMDGHDQHEAVASAAQRSVRVTHVAPMAYGFLWIVGDDSNTSAQTLSSIGVITALRSGPWVAQMPRGVPARRIGSPSDLSMPEVRARPKRFCRHGRRIQTCHVLDQAPAVVVWDLGRGDVAREWSALPTAVSAGTTAP